MKNYDFSNYLFCISVKHDTSLATLVPLKAKSYNRVDVAKSLFNSTRLMMNVVSRQMIESVCYQDKMMKEPKTKLEIPF
jgi:hypothetical protein